MKLQISINKCMPACKSNAKRIKGAWNKKLKVVYSKEEPVLKRRVPMSNAFTPSVAGLLLAGEVMRTNFITKVELVVLFAIIYHMFGRNYWRMDYGKGSTIFS